MRLKLQAAEHRILIIEEITIDQLVNTRYGLVYHETHNQEFDGFAITAAVRILVKKIFPVQAVPLQLVNPPGELEGIHLAGVKIELAGPGNSN